MNDLTIYMSGETISAIDGHPVEQVTFSFNVEVDDAVTKMKTGMYVLPDGSIVAHEDVKVHTRFIDYGPEDIDYLLMAGIIKEHEADYVRVLSNQVHKWEFMVEAAMLEPLLKELKLEGDEFCWPPYYVESRYGMNPIFPANHIPLIGVIS